MSIVMSISVLNKFSNRSRDQDWDSTILIIPNLVCFFYENMPTVLSKLTDFFTSSSASYNAAQIRKLAVQILAVYQNNRTLLGRTIWFVTVYLLYIRKSSSGKKRRTEAGNAPTAEEVARQKKRVEVMLES
jgi:hypothetical protein